MSYLTTGLDLKADALFLAGEPSSGSDYDDRAYEWLTVVQRTLVSGGQLGPGMLQPVDWPWAKAWPRGAIQLVQPYNQALTVTATFTTGATTVTVTPDLPDLAGYRIFRADTPARHIIDSVNNNATPNQIILREPWTGETVTDAEWKAYPDTYTLPGDFVRGSSPLFVSAGPMGAASSWSSPYVIDIVDAGDLERAYPQGYTGVMTQGIPVLAARVTDTRIRFSHFLDTPENSLPVQIEFEYIARPPVIAEGTIPAVPIEHRRILSYGAAYLILNDKNDNGDASLYAMFQSQYRGMLQEYLREHTRMSSRFGQIQPSRMSGRSGPPFYTSSGLPIWSW